MKQNVQTNNSFSANLSKSSMKIDENKLHNFTQKIVNKSACGKPMVNAQKQVRSDNDASEMVIWDILGQFGRLSDKFGPLVELQDCFLVIFDHFLQ